MSGLRILIAVALSGMAVWIAYAAYSGRYLEAVAVSCVGPVLLWFASGAGASSRNDDEDP